MMPVERWWLCTMAVDMRKGIDSLVALVLSAFTQGTQSHTAYVFCNRHGTRLKVVLWDGLGFWLCARRLERGRFVLPVNTDAPIELSAEQFAWLIAGVDWQRLGQQRRMPTCI